MENIERNFNLGDVVLIIDTYDECVFTAHCSQRTESLKMDGTVQVTFKFVVNQNTDDDITYVVGEDRSDNIYDFGDVVGNINSKLDK